MRNGIVEFIGSFFLVLTVGLSGGNALAIGSALMVMVYLGGHLSGGHYNPAVTVAVCLRGRLSASQVIPYFIAQVLGATGAGCVFYYLKGSHFGPAPTIDPLHAAGAEFLYTFALCSVVLAVATSEKLKGNQFYGLAIGFTVLIGVASIGGLTGAALNPAVATGPALSALIFGAADLSNLWIYWAGPIGAGVVAALLYRFLYRV